jgi:hypothetical protein
LGINSLVYEENHDPKKDLMVQTKRKFMPTQIDNSPEFGRLFLPATLNTSLVRNRDMNQTMRVSEVADLDGKLGFQKSF